jgi:hypothetical protein
MNPQSYGSGSAFRIALEARLKDRAATEDIDLQRLRRRVAFDLAFVIRCSLVQGGTSSLGAAEYSDQRPVESLFLLQRRARHQCFDC